MAKGIVLLLALAGCTAPAGATIVRVNGEPLWLEHPITQAKIAECRKVDQKFHIDNSCGIEILSH